MNEFLQTLGVVFMAGCSGWHVHRKEYGWGVYFTIMSLHIIVIIGGR
jgi:hypothetical protein